VTEDRLSVHVQKHDLNFDGLTASLFTGKNVIPTQIDLLASFTTLRKHHYVFFLLSLRF